ncbi:hypothetical protein PRZ48_000853 [Zasmidium cellare]|uniref:Uncharacterized protein n=1 Tax=Zasmidium cellare TaxID=395010 RepID=A0ABR0F0J7_ZASCE|nr:hypothetical protein PRZ48_000853 [Zasmidium cellare]
MLSVLLALLPLAASHDVKPIEFGRPAPIGTLISLPTPAASNERPINKSEQQPYIHLENASVDQIQMIMDADFAEIDDSLEDSSEFDQYVPIGTTDDTTLVRRGNGIEKRAAFRGTMQIDCLEAPEVCQNACWYQNCLNDPTTPIRYQDGGRNSGRDSANRLQSGVTVSRGTPCQTWPFGQMFWDTYQFNPNPVKDSEKYLETDEWPMASFENPAFDETADPPQHTLRCITGQSNKGGARAWTNFRRGHGPYAAGGKWEKFRNGAKTHFVRYDEFNVEFNFDSFDANNPDHQNIRKTITYCDAPYTCANDGRQFHMSKLVTNGKTQGQLAWPYDATSQNAYQLDKEGTDIKQYHVTLAITGDDQDEVSAQVSVYENGSQDPTILATRDSTTDADITMQDGDSFSIKGDLPKTLKVEKSGIGCGTFKFTYGDAATDGLAVFGFDSEDQGYGRWSHTEKGKLSGRYCVPEDIEGQDANGADVVIGTRLKCSFPGW